MENLNPFIIDLQNNKKPYYRILWGPPYSVSMRSEMVMVSLSTGEDVGAHNTEDYEELLIILTGIGEARIEGQSSLDITGAMWFTIPSQVLLCFCKQSS